MHDVAERIASLRSAFQGRFGISYAMKCNPNPRVIKWMRANVDTLDVSSRGELQRSIAAGWAPSSVSFTGPAKSDEDLRFAVRAQVGEVVLESFREAAALSRLAVEMRVEQKVLVRIAPADVPRRFGVNMSGKPTQFGIDEEDLPQTLRAIKELPGVRIVGFHAYSGTQCLRADAIAENWLNFARLFRSACEELDIVPEKLVFGSGLGICYQASDVPVDLASLASKVNPEIDQVLAQNRFNDAVLLLETGRYLIGESGIYLTKVVHTKFSSTTVLLNLSHHPAPATRTLQQRSGDGASQSEPARRD